tara:strand:+ start:838 stop:2052 length:1215 start_codon:yes stop_codon:yes gene_type:complete
VFFYVARQPILTQDKQLFGYELLFRDGPHNAFPNVTSDEATLRLVEGGEFNTGIRQLTDDHHAFVNFSEQAILEGLPRLLPVKGTVVELLETIQPTEQILAAVKALKADGYQIALDDFEYTPEWLAFLPYVDIIKVDFRALNIPQIRQLLSNLREFKGQYLAEKIETPAEFSQACKLGFSLFQGYFFARPEMIQRRALNASQTVCMQLLELSSQPNYEVNAIVALIERDISLTYKLLRFVNSALFKRQSEIQSIHQAIVRLGQSEVCRFTALMATATLAEGKPDELIKLSFVRARFMEQLALSNQAYGADSTSAFLTGLLSKLDAMMDNDLSAILEGVAISSEIKRTLIEGKGPLSFFLKVCEAIEASDWTKIELFAKRLRIEANTLVLYYHQAHIWVREVGRH